MQLQGFSGIQPGLGAQHAFGVGQAAPMHMMMQLIQVLIQMLGQMGGGRAAGGFPMGQNPGFGGSGAGFGGQRGGGSPIQDFRGGPGPGELSNQGLGAPLSHHSPELSSAPFAGTGGGDLAAKLPQSMKSLASHFQAAGAKYNIDPKFLAAISMLETGKGTSSAFRNKRNAMGVSNSRGPISFQNPAQSIYRMAKTLSNPKGPYRRANTIAGIGRVYAPPGAGNDPNGTNGYWPRGVSKYYAKLGGNPSAAVLRR